MSIHWFIITGEYPPQPGGISDYTHLVASALAAAGDTVEIWTGPSSPETANTGNIPVHRTSEHFSLRARNEIGAAWNRLPSGARVLVQYEPWSFGYKGLNLPFAWWLRRCRRRRPDVALTIMFHEVATDFGWNQRFKQSVHGLLSHGMARVAARTADRVFMSVLVWEPVLRSLLRADQSPEWLPVPSNVPRTADTARTAALRQQLLGVSSGLIVGHFSTFRGEIPEMLRAMLPQLLASKSCAAILLLGRGGAEFAAAVREEHPGAAGRIVAAGEMGLEAVSEHLAACDLLIQPYPDGVSSRRTTVMAGLNLGLPILTNAGHCSDPHLWENSGAVRVVNSAQPMEIGAAAVTLMEDGAGRAALAIRARQFYDERFSVERVVETLRRT